MIVVAVKWVDLRPDVDPLTGVVHTDARRYGFSDADRSALEVALRLAEARSTTVTLVSAAPAAAEPALRELAASGVTAVVRIDAPEPLESSVVGRSIAAAIATEAIGYVVTGDHSLDRGSGSVPAFAAHALELPQALGLISVGAGSPLDVVRRLDGGRREHLRLDGPAVLAVEGSVARLRRATMRDVLAAKSLPLTVVAPVAASAPVVRVDRTQPVRPRARAFSAPHGNRALQRIVELTGALVERTPPRRVEAGPADAAAEIVAQLRAWGYIE